MHDRNCAARAPIAYNSRGVCAAYLFCSPLRCSSRAIIKYRHCYQHHHPFEQRQEIGTHPAGSSDLDVCFLFVFFWGGLLFVPYNIYVCSANSNTETAASRQQHRKGFTIDGFPTRHQGCRKVWLADSPSDSWSSLMHCLSMQAAVCRLGILQG